MKVLVVDDHPLVREGVRHALASLQGDVEVLEAGNSNQALELAEQHPDLTLVMLDLGLPGMPGLAALEELRVRGCAAPVVVLSGSCERADVIAALNTGAMGFIPKLSSSDVMLQALRLVLAGGIYIPPQALGMLDGPGGVAAGTTGPKSLQQLGLSERQQQVLALIAQGKPNKVIASDLNIAEPTVKAHITEILRALQVTNRSQAMIVARRFGVR
ncbi:MAG: response regulator transcription factor [Betaproteobacteria bacterium]|nr:MAG: response regulator transcription factor [Betaproteobacteria bacterium]